MSENDTATEIGSYTLIKQLGAGGMGEVWEAEHQMLGRQAAVKVIRPGIAAHDPKLQETLGRRFEREARAMSQLRSPHTVEIYDFGSTVDGRFYYAMELLDGFDMRELVERHGALPPERVVHLLKQMAESLGEAHQSKLVHRDIKPSNVVVARVGIRTDFVKVLDFGLVKLLETEAVKATRLTQQGAATGSPAFMAPEVILDDRAGVDAHTDIYSTGCVAYFLLTGRLVFEADSAMKMMMAHVNETPKPPSAYSEFPVPEELDELVLRCLSKSPTERPADGQELLLALHEITLDEPWTDARAMRWWSHHMPTASLTRPALAAVKRSPTASSPAAAAPLPRAKPLEDERDRVVSRLQSAFGAGELTMTEYDQRLDMAQAAKERRELAMLTVDLPAAAVSSPVVPLPMNAPDKPMDVTAFFGSAARKGSWTVPSVVKARGIFGGVQLDLRGARLTAPLTTIRCLALFGSVSVTVPPGVRIETEGRGIFGGFEQTSDTVPAGAEAKVVRLTGLALFGGVDVKVKPREGDVAALAHKPS